MGKEQSFNITNMRNFFAKENMEKLFADCPTITLKKNECIYATEQILTDVFLVSQGMVEVFITNEQGHKQVRPHGSPYSASISPTILSG